MQAAKDGYTNVAVFGFAGGHMQPGQPELLSSELFEKMVTEAHRIITETWALDLNVVRLVSGGAAWSDHVAVELFNRHNTSSQIKLALLMPCEWSNTTGRFVEAESKSKDWRENPARLANSYHEKFSRVRDGTAMGSRHELRAACGAGAWANARYRGFHSRNTAIAEGAQYALAFSWYDEVEPSGRGGTADTWSKLKADCTRHHVRMVELAGRSQAAVTAKRATDQDTASRKAAKPCEADDDDEK
jgi:hypothetical protein